MKKIIFSFVFMLIAGVIFGQTEIDTLNILINYLNKPVPSGAIRVNRTEYYRDVLIEEIYSVYEVFIVSENNVIMAANQVVGNSRIITRYYGQLFTIFEPLGVPAKETREGASWVYGDYVIMIDIDNNGSSSSVCIYVLSKNNLDLFRKITRN